MSRKRRIDRILRRIGIYRRIVVAIKDAPAPEGHVVTHDGSLVKIQPQDMVLEILPSEAKL